MKVIINADDFGYSDHVNETIAALMDARRITSATLMGSGERLPEAARLTKQLPHCSFGVHLTLTEVAPLTAPDPFRQAGLLNDAGQFNDRVRSIRPTRALKEAVFREWSAQVQRVVDNGVEISHFDSHHHVHTVPWLFGTLKRLQRLYRVSRIRQSLNWYWNDETTPSRMLLLKKRIWNTAIRFWPATRTTDCFSHFDWFLKNMARGNYQASNTAELMVHPGQPYAIEETQLLWGDWLTSMPCQVQLINYRDI